MIRSIEVDMLGGLRVFADGVPVLEEAGKVNKPWQVFAYLVLNRQGPTPASRLLDALWPEEDLADPANVLKNTVYALRREFKGAAGPKESPVLFENGGYLCNPAIVFALDAQAFTDRLLQAEALEGDERIEALRMASTLYKGDLLPQLGEEAWVVGQALFYKKKYAECVRDLCDRLYAQGRYSELLAEATTASKVDPLDDSVYLYIFRALYALDMFRVIIPTYHKTLRIFTEELGVPLDEEIVSIYRSASEKINKIEQDIMIIKDDLREVAQDDRPINGPLYCTYDVFKYLYQMVARASERAGNRILIVLLTLQLEDGAQPPAKELSTAMSQVKTHIMGGLLRKSDTVARYSKSQYIIMLSSEYADGAEAVMKRIKTRCQPFLSPHGIRIVFTTTELEPLDRG